MDNHKRTSNPRIENIDEEQILLEKLLLDRQDWWWIILNP